MTGTWWFIRHGQSTANAEGWLAGHRDAPLTERGVGQARALRPAVASLTPQRVLTSDLQRAWRTAQLALGADGPLPIEQYPALRERHLGDWEGRSKARLKETGEKSVLHTWTQGPPRGESQQALSRRVLSWLAEHDDGRDTMLFAHGGLIRCVVGLLDGLPTDRIGRWDIQNASVLERRVPEGAWQRLLGALGTDEATAGDPPA